MKNNKGFVVSAVLYPLLVIFLALIMGLLAMTDTRKRILDKMKLEISDSIFDEEACSCDTILSKLNYLIKNGASGGGGGSYTHNVLGLSVTAYEAPSALPNIGNSVGDIGVITDVEIANYYVSTTAPETPKEGTIWIVQDRHSDYYVESDYSKIGISYVMQYVADKWTIKKSYVFDNEKGWTLLYYIPVSNGEVDLTSSELNGNVVYDFSYTGEYQTFYAPFSGTYEIELWGASGGGYDESRMNTYAGKGAYTKGTIYLDAGTALYIYVGGTSGTSYHDSTLSGKTNTGYYTAGGWNGGGTGSYRDTNNYGKGGGGATDIRLVSTDTKTEWNEFNSLKSRIMVAAGGGGYEYISAHLYGGDGGTLTGDGGHNTSKTVVYGNGAQGGTQMLGGFGAFRAVDDEHDGENGSFGKGGDGPYYAASGGGGGYYGGGGGGHDGSVWTAGGGGSSYISGYKGCNAVDATSTADNIIHTGSSYHYSGYYFEDTEMTAAANTGNGKATITLKSIEVLDKTQLLEADKKENDNQWEYTYTGDYEAFIAPYSGTYKVELWGASGGSNKITNTVQAGKGGYTTGEIYLEKGTTLYVYVGGQGGIEARDSTGREGYSTYYSAGGYNGGGDGTYYNDSHYGTGGGGATDIRLVSGVATSFDSLKSRIMVAGGGGGTASINNTLIYGGSNNGLTGSHGHYTDVKVTVLNGENGATQSSGGVAVFRMDKGDNNHLNYSGENGSFGIGGEGANYYASGGGGGYYGGGGGGNNRNDSHITGGGGSSYISGYEGCNSIAETSTATNIESTGSAYHYSGYYFKNAEMSSSDNFGDGKAVITLVKKEEVSSSALEAERVAGNRTWSYDYSGSYQTFTAPVSGTYQMELWGASGGYYHYTWTDRAGKGAYTKGSIYLEKGTKLYIYVGGHGGYSQFNANDATNRETVYYSTGGYNGGGNGYWRNDSNWGTGGGGATDIRIVSGSADSFNSLKSRIMVAAGGGGIKHYQNGSSQLTNYGANGGALEGQNGKYQNNVTTYYLNGSTGATQTSGGKATFRMDDKLHIGVDGSFGVGGNGAYYFASGGGGGYYGGGGGGHNLTVYVEGSGGSSYISGYEGCNSITEGSTKDNIVHTGSSYHYSGYYFTGTSMTAGENLGNGKALITLQTAETKPSEEIQNTKLQSEREWHYYYSGTYQVFTAPINGTYEITLNGAEGGFQDPGNRTYAGKGATTKGSIYLNAGTKLYVYVGGQGGLKEYNALETGASATNYISTGGWNGGGKGIRHDGSNYGHGGGGATDIRLVAGETSDFDSLKSRIMVAAGGAGANYASAWHKGGNGGTLEGEYGRFKNDIYTYINGSKGGTQTGGGKATYRADNTLHIGVDGSFGLGGAGAYYYGSGGGGGYYGGGGGGHNRINGQIAGAGGSSYISGYVGCNSIAESSTESNIIHTGSSYHYSGYYFTGTSMEAGTTEGNGSATIVLTKVETKDQTQVDTEKLNTENEWHFTYAGTYQEFTAPVNGTYEVTLNGAEGGYYNYDNEKVAGNGATTKGNIYLKAGTKLYVYVGSQGGLGRFNAYESGQSHSGYIATGGYNGGGEGKRHGDSYFGNGGGGATDIRLVSGNASDFDSLKSRIMVAAGGGGGFYYGSEWHYGGNGGTLEGAYGRNVNNLLTANNNLTNGAKGGTQTSGGTATFRSDDPNGSGKNGSFGLGGDGAYNHASGGGGGYYGGGGAGYNYNVYIAGAGGSSYISGYTGCNSVAETSTASNIIHTGSSYHYSGYYFTGTSMEEGTTEGNGSAVIKLISRDVQEDTTTPVGTEFSYTYSGTAQTFTVPQTGYYNIQLWGAQGGYWGYSNKDMAGKGAYTSGRIYLTKGTKLYVYVGGQGGMKYFNASGWTGYSTYYSTGGWNGGGDGTYYNTSNWGHGGGGATDIRTVVTASISEWNEEESLRSRIMVAAGGAGNMYQGGNNYGASGGGLTGYNGRYRAELTIYANSATGGTQTSGGIGTLTTNQVYGEKTSTGGDGGFGFGGTGSYYYSSGGGSGWYGGGGGGSATGKAYMSAGSGSSYISGHAGCIGVTASGKANAETYTDMNDSLSHTGFKFTNTVMIDGYGYSWTDTVSTDTSGMPTYDGTDTMIGNSGNGYAKITYLGV